jgi:cytochrome c553
MTERTILLSLLGAFAFANSVPAEEVSLSRDVMPLIARSCTGCHQREGGNRKAVDHGPYLEKKSDILGLVGTMIVAGKPENSYLLMTVSKPQAGRPSHKMMPPKRSKAPRLTDQEVQKVTDWIEAGAKDN